MIVLIPEVGGLPLITRAKEIAARLGIDVEYYGQNQFELVDVTIIYLTVAGISIQLPGKSNEKPIFIDFASSKMQYRQKNSSTRKELIARAVGLKSGQSPLILDTTAGLGGDSFILATLGAKITMLERNPFIHLLLEDALMRASSDDRLVNIVKRMELIKADAVEFLDDMAITPDIIYMDPMFPERSKTALNKKEMRLFQEIAGRDSDAGFVLAKALTKAKKRVVVKRPQKSAYLDNIKPGFSMEGKSCRFDIYIINS